MKKQRYVFGLLLAVTVLTIPLMTHALGNGLIDTNLGSTFGLGTADLKSTVIKIIQWILGLLGLIAVIFMLYGGFMWMTAGGNEERVSTAKKIITSALIGLVVVLLAWAIVIFVVGTATNVTT